MKTRKAALIDQYVTALLQDRAADPPPDLDAQTVRAVRAIMAAQRVGVPSGEVKQRVWQRARTLAGGSTIAPEARGPKPSTNGHGPESQFAIRELVRRRQAARPRWSPSLSLVTALIAAVLFAGLFTLMQQATTPSGPRVTVEESVFERTSGRRGTRATRICSATF